MGHQDDGNSQERVALKYGQVFLIKVGSNSVFNITLGKITCKKSNPKTMKKNTTTKGMSRLL